ncbi:hypothetical protein C8R44DRAFT_782751 [Mycena epipterygia]|nr:hypothetical protein C8R44DRAFT_782751 [Mycena epipterygia]
MDLYFYQLGGFDAAIYSYGRNPLGSKVYEPLRRSDGLELVLGIKRSGTSHLLLTSGERDVLLRQDRSLREGRPRTTTFDFESLSPILFRDLRELDAKLEALKPVKNNRDTATDTSPLNKQYHGGEYGIARGQFENCRVFYRVLQGPVDKPKFGLGDTSWSSSMRVFSFCYNLWLLDARSPQDRQRLPKVLDVGWCEAPTPTLGGEMKMSRHIIVENNKLLKNPNMGVYEYATDHGATETLDARTVAAQVQEFFGRYTEPTTSPIVLLVHDKQTAVDVLKSFGVDVSKWDFELKNLLRPMQSPPPRRQAPNDPRRPRGRSASPHPQDRPRRNSPPPRRYAPVYVVDIKSMFVAVLSTTYHSETVPALVKRLGLFEPTGWCAGNECLMLVDAFRAMAQGSAIDEQKKEWPDSRVQTASNDEEQSEYAGSDSD